MNARPETIRFLRSCPEGQVVVLTVVVHPLPGGDALAFGQSPVLFLAREIAAQVTDEQLTNLLVAKLLNATESAARLVIEQPKEGE